MSQAGIRIGRPDTGTAAGEGWGLKKADAPAFPSRQTPPPLSQRTAPLMCRYSGESLQAEERAANSHSENFPIRLLSSLIGLVVFERGQDLWVGAGNG